MNEDGAKHGKLHPERRVKMKKNRLTIARYFFRINQIGR